MLYDVETNDFQGRNIIKQNTLWLDSGLSSGRVVDSSENGEHGIMMWSSFLTQLACFASRMRSILLLTHSLTHLKLILKTNRNQQTDEEKQKQPGSRLTWASVTLRGLMYVWCATREWCKVTYRKFEIFTNKNNNNGAKNNTTGRCCVYSRERERDSEKWGVDRGRAMMLLCEVVARGFRCRPQFRGIEACVFLYFRNSK